MTLTLSLAETPGPFVRHIVQIFNGLSEQELWYDLIANHPGCVSDAALYAYSLGEISSNWSLPTTPPYGASFMEKLTNLSAPGVRVTPVVQCGGDNLVNNFKYASLWAGEFGKAADQYNYSGFVLDGEISHDSSSGTQEAYVEFLNVWADQLHAKNRTLAVVVRYDFPKDILAKARVDAILSYYYEDQGKTDDYIKEVGKYGGKVCVLTEPKLDWHHPEITLAAAENEKEYWLGAWSNFEGNDPARSDIWYKASALWTLKGGILE